MNFKSILKQQKGAALIAVMAVISTIIIALQSASSNSRIEYAKARNSFVSLSARYNARSAAEISLLRLLIYSEGVKLLKTNPQIEKLVTPYLNLIWSYPFVWPIPISEESSESNKEEIEESVEQSLIKGSYSTAIRAEDGKIDINDLSSPIEHVRNFTYDSLANLINLLIEDNSKLREKYRGSGLTNLINNLSDWTDEDNASQNGGSEDNIDSNKKPLNRSFFYLGEIKEVPEMTEDLYKLLKPHITVYGVKGVNINLATEEVLISLGLPEIVAEEVIKRSDLASPEYSPFSSTDDFCKYLEQRSVGFCKRLEESYRSKEIIKFNTALHFLVETQGKFRNISGRVELMTYSHLEAANTYKQAVIQQKKIEQGTNQKEGSTQSKKQKKDASQQEEKDTNSNNLNSFPFTIMYWKENI